MNPIPVTAGFMPLLDSVILVTAHEKGFAAREGLAFELTRETSWANIRDRVGVGHFDIAHMLAPMPLASALGLAPLPARFIAPFVLGLGNNAVTVSAALWERMAEAGATANLDAATTGRALKAVVDRGQNKLRFGVVHHYSAHNYELRYWLTASGIAPDRDVEIVVLPPPLLPDALGAGAIDGYCVGEPWNSIGVARQNAHIATVKASIWRSSADKVIGLRQAWADENPQTLLAVLRALHGAALWCSDTANHEEAARIVAAPKYLNEEVAIVRRALTGRLAIGAGVERVIPDFYVPYAGAANFPRRRHALWFYSQMVRWGDVNHSAANAALAAASFRPDLYRAALEPLGVMLPDPDAMPGGPSDEFFDGEAFDPKELEAYMARQQRIE